MFDPMPTIRHMVRFETKSYAKRCKEQTAEELKELKERKISQLILLGSGMSASVLVTTVFGSLGLLGCALGLRQISILRQQLHIIEEAICGKATAFWQKAFQTVQEENEILREQLSPMPNLDEIFATPEFMEHSYSMMMRRQAIIKLLFYGNKKESQEKEGGDTVFIGPNLPPLSTESA